MTNKYDVIIRLSELIREYYFNEDEEKIPEYKALIEIREKMVDKALGPIPSVHPPYPIPKC